MRQITIEELINKMRSVGEQLIPYNFPISDPKSEEELAILKTKEVFIDGYNIVLHYTKANYKSHFIESIQILGKNSYFLPFNLVIKIAVKFLGQHDLSLIEILRENRKIYCWTIAVDKHGKPLKLQSKQGTKEDFENFTYTKLDAAEVNFY